MSLLFLLAAIGVGVWGYFHFLYSKPLSKAELAELTPDWDKATGGNWSPWFVQADGTTVWNPAASYNAWLATVPEDEKAWPVLCDIYVAHRQLLDESDDLGSLPEQVDDWSSLRDLLDSEQLRSDIGRLKSSLRKPVLGAFIYGTSESSGIGSRISNETFDPEMFAAMQSHGVENPHLITGLPANPSLIGVELPGELRDFERLLCADAFALAQDGEFDACIETLDVASSIAGYFDAFPDLIGQLYALAIEAKVNTSIEHLLVHHGEVLDDAQLVALDAILTRHGDRSFNWQGAALGEHDTVRRIINQKGQLMASSLSAMSGFNGSLTTPTQLPDSQLGDAAQRLLHTTNLDLRAIDDQIPWDPNRNATLVARAQSTKMPFMASMFHDMFSVGSGMIGRNYREYRQRCIALRLAVAMRRSMLRHGAFPLSLESIDKDLIGFDPIDAFGGNLQFRIIDASPLIYSKGDDRDDDGGSPMLDYDIVALFGTSPGGNTQMMRRYNKSKKESGGVRERPLWITPARVKEIEAVEPDAVDGDWVLYPEPEDD